MKIALLASASPRAQDARARLATGRSLVSPEDADVIVALGGDGFMLDVLHWTAHLGTPVYGMNRGTVGFLMNAFDDQGLEARIEAARLQHIRPLKLTATDTAGRVQTALAINEVSLLRMGAQAANIRISVDGACQMDCLMADGVLLSTPAGSTAYNASAFGPILPLGTNALALTPIAAFRPRRWRGAVLPDTARVLFENCDPEKRPLMVNADSRAFEDILQAEVSLDPVHSHALLFDPGHSLEDRILREQFT